MGFILGPKVLSILNTGDFGKMGGVLTTIALSVILFEGGVNLKIKPLKKAWDETLLLTLPTFVLSMLLFTTLLSRIGCRKKVCNMKLEISKEVIKNTVVCNRNFQFLRNQEKSEHPESKII
jgi:predicted Na+-dependent transporter